MASIFKVLHQDKWIYTFTHTRLWSIYLPHRRVWLWWCQRPAQGNRNTWRFESAPQSYSYYSSDGWPPPHMSPASPGMRLRERERKGRGEGDYLLEIHWLLGWLIVVLTVGCSKKKWSLNYNTFLPLIIIKYTPQQLLRGLNKSAELFTFV